MRISKQWVPYSTKLLHRVRSKLVVKYESTYNKDTLKKRLVKDLSNDSVVFFYHYENTPIEIYWKLYNQKRENFPIKNSDIFHISAQNIDCRYSLEPPRQGGSNEYPQSMFWAEIRKIMYTPVNPSFTI